MWRLDAVGKRLWPKLTLDVTTLSEFLLGLSLDFTSSSMPRQDNPLAFHFNIQILTIQLFFVQRLELLMRLIIAFKFVDVIGYMDGNDMWNSYTNCYFSMGHVSNRLEKRGKFMYSSVSASVFY